MKLMNFIIFILIFNVMCGVVSAIPNSDGSKMFGAGGIQKNASITSETQYKDTTGGGAMEKLVTLFSKLTQWAKALFLKVYQVLFGLPYLIQQAFPGGLSGPAAVLVGGLDAVTAGMWVLLIAWLYKGAEIE